MCIAGAKTGQDKVLAGTDANQYWGGAGFLRGSGAATSKGDPLIVSDAPVPEPNVPGRMWWVVYVKGMALP